MTAGGKRRAKERAAEKATEKAAAIARASEPSLGSVNNLEVATTQPSVGDAPLETTTDDNNGGGTVEPTNEAAGAAATIGGSGEAEATGLETVASDQTTQVAAQEAVLRAQLVHLEVDVAELGHNDDGLRRLPEGARRAKNQWLLIIVVMAVTLVVMIVASGASR